VQDRGRPRADPFITADTLKKALSQLAAFTIVHLNAKDAPAPHIWGSPGFLDKSIGVTP
jgi:hypothetical protein